MNIFEEATKQAIRFHTPRGSLTVEDMWVADLEMVDMIAVSFQEDLERTSTKSFLKDVNEENKHMRLKLDILKHIIESRLAEIEEAKQVARRKQRNQLIMRIIENKQNEELESKSIEELTELMEQDA